jgi:hypothetical protein
MGKEGVVFQMIDEGRSPEEARKVFWTKVGLFLVATAAVAGLMYYVFTASLTF